MNTPQPNQDPVHSAPPYGRAGYLAMLVAVLAGLLFLAGLDIRSGTAPRRDAPDHPVLARDAALAPAPARTAPGASPRPVRPLPHAACAARSQASRRAPALPPGRAPPAAT